MNSEFYCEFDQVHRAHALYYAALLAQYSPQTAGAGSNDKGVAQKNAFHVLRTELGNIAAAFDSLTYFVNGVTPSLYSDLE